MAIFHAYSRNTKQNKGSLNLGREPLTFSVVSTTVGDPFWKSVSVSNIVSDVN